MMRWIAVAALVGLAVGGAASLGSARAQADAVQAIWRAAGIVPFPRSLEAPPFQLSDLSGASVDLQQFHGRLVMLYFWASW